MPDINLLRESETGESPPKKPLPPKGVGPLSDPSAQKGLGGMLRALFNRPRPAVPTPPAPSEAGRMSLGRARPDERILTETRKARPAVIPLPEEDESFDVNLLTEDVVVKFEPRKKLMQLGLAAAVAVAVVGAGYGGLAILDKSVTGQISSTREQLQEVNREVAKLQATQRTILTTTKRVGAIQTLIDQHIRWTKFFRQLEKYTLPTVEYGSSFSADTKGEILLTAHTTSYEEVARQYLIFEQAVGRGDFIDSFSITGANVSDDGKTRVVAFNVSLHLTSSLLLNAATDNSQSSDASLKQAAQAAASLRAVGYAVCDLYDHPEDIQFMPDFLRTDLTAAVQAGSPTDCQQFNRQDLAQAAADMKIDQDGDGLNLVFERVYGSDDAVADTDGDGVSDLAELKACADPTGTGTLSGCQPTTT